MTSSADYWRNPSRTRGGNAARGPRGYGALWVAQEFIGVHNSGSRSGIRCGFHGQVRLGERLHPVCHRGTVVQCIVDIGTRATPLSSVMLVPRVPEDDLAGLKGSDHSRVTHDDFSAIGSLRLRLAAKVFKLPNNCLSREAVHWWSLSVTRASPCPFTVRHRHHGRSLCCPSIAPRFLARLHRFIPRCFRLLSTKDRCEYSAVLMTKCTGQKVL